MRAPSLTCLWHARTSLTCAVRRLQGTPLNPLVDLGQLEGGFMMAIGYYLTEEVVFAKDSGEQLTLGAWEYKVPRTPPLTLTRDPDPNPTDAAPPRQHAHAHRIPLTCMRRARACPRCPPCMTSRSSGM